MPQGFLFINGDDAFTEYGVSMDTASLSALMTPAGIKDHVENNPRRIDGKQVLFDAHVAPRDLTLTINLVASDEDDFFEKYEDFCEVLSSGKLTIRTKYQPDVYYRCLYQSCTAFSQFMQGIAKFTLKLNEPNPTDRAQTPVQNSLFQ